LKHYTYIRNERRHVFLREDEDLFTLEESDLERICDLYVSSGHDMNQKSVAGEIGISVADLKTILSHFDITKASAPVSPTYIEEHTVDEAVELITAKKQKLIRMKLAAAQLNRVEKEAARQDNVRVSLVEMIKEHVMPLDAPERRSKARKATGLSSKSYVYSDWHTGSSVTSKRDTYRGFDKYIFRSRIAECLDTIKDDDKPECVNVIFLGDILDGPLGNMQRNQAARQDLHGMEQVNEAAEAIVSIVRKAVKVHRTCVNVFSVGGNHDRTTEDRRDDPERFANQLLMEIVRLRLIKYIDKGHVKMFATKEVFQSFAASKSVRFILNHGDNNAKPVNLVTLDAIRHSGFRVILQGHLHQRRIEEGNGFMKILTPTLVGGSEWAEGQLAVSNRPGQSIIRVYENSEGKFSVQTEWVDLAM